MTHGASAAPGAEGARPGGTGATDAGGAPVEREVAAARAKAYDAVYRGWTVKRVTRESYEAATRFFLDAPAGEPGHLDGNELGFAFQLLGVDRLEGRRILDYCCGAGRSSIYFALRGARVWGCDRSEEAVRIARRSAIESGVAASVQFAVADVQELAFPSDYFDAVFCQSALHIVADYPAAARELARVLKPGGKAVFCEEALGHNPVLEVVRARRRRRHAECGGRTLRMDDLRRFGEAFSRMQVYPFNFFLQSKQFFGRRAHTGWAKLFLRVCRTADTALLGALPFLKRYCGKVVVEYVKEGQGAGSALQITHDK
ncbi:MAG: methyltransferase domain-containing protein [Phycisphaerae bacterium]|nr:MAG: class I SAM-dependent methyltransferase [Planctomycetota bacterium]KAB2944728.1 MAG: class I SAM-dependent methyltransferase [Phycisphaerae bacterium]MBE7456767.1 class I SAM-dependent methyltransferase [Planctomycetia bacterium]MCK6464216.1 class I SAM-dependent methyltransferase [Phycisphaerae bacterium]MCL4717807.1 methyltransferase domain-containing protein [Phycisphaerae bacterium]